jgi:hypothetical protein
MGLKEQIKQLSASKKPLKVSVDGLDIYIRCISIGERDRWEQQMAQIKDKTFDNFRAQYLAFVLCDSDGARLWKDEEVPELAGMSAYILGPLFDKALAYNKMSEADIRELAGE